MSSFSWLDHSESQRRRMLEIVATFQEQGTVDELGIGSVRDAISDTLLPGTSVLHTRARYLLFVPWICRAVERDGVAAAQAGTRLRNDEVKLIYALERGGESLGIVGREARERTKRLPAVIYWGALGRYGIRSFPGTVSQWARSLGSGSGVSRRPIIADDGSVIESGKGAWHPGLPAEPDDFLDEANFALRPQEADYLQERVLAVASTSFLAHLVVAGERRPDAGFAWEHPAAATAPAAIQEHLSHARVFSELMHGASLLYNLILAEEVLDLRSTGGELTVDEDLTDLYRGAMDEWVALLDGRLHHHRVWDRAAFWSLVTKRNPRVPYHTRFFIDAWLDLALERPEELVDDPRARALVRNRERQIKRGLARAGNPRQLERWSGASGTGRLDYRWNGVRLMLDDLIVGVLNAREATRALT